MAEESRKPRKRRSDWGKSRKPYKRRSEYRSDRYRGICECGEHAWAVLTKGYVTFVSPQDAHFLSEANWYAFIDNNNQSQSVYAVRMGKKVSLHCAILDCPAAEPDHKNHLCFDNRRENLRPCTSSQNKAHRRLRPGVSGYRGVHPRGKRYFATIMVGGKSLSLGTYDTSEQAARVYDDAAQKYFGDFAMLNFPKK